jgi:cytochrome c oxidase cbb3-type subunit 3
MNETTTKQPDAVQTTGHAWDGDLQEFNNPLPRWWLWTFYATVVFSIIYWLIYPSWPVGDSWLKGTKTVDVRIDGAEQEVRWNTRSQLLHDLQSGDAATRQQEYMEKIAAVDFDQIGSDADMLAFARSVGRGLFGDNCAACHGRGGQGVVSMYPNLVDDNWMWGGTMEQIEQTLIHGRNGFMPAFKQVLSDEQLDDVTEYVLTMSGEAQSSQASERGREIFHGKAGGCHYCHGDDGKGLQAMGAANLTDKIWEIANVTGQNTLESKKAVVKQFIGNGVQNIRKMPGWKDRLSATDIKLLAVYVHQLGGGQ